MEKKFGKLSNSLVLGKFMPFHLGHKFLIDSALEQSEIVHVMVCSLPDDPIAGNLRYNWVKSTYLNDSRVKVYHCEDINPQYPNECDSLTEFYAFWTKSVWNIIDDLSAVFTSEDYGDEFASYLGVVHIQIDLERKNYPISGTMCRTDIYKHWAMLPEIVKLHYVRSVALLGPESVGKSVMTEMLAKEFNTTFAPEYGREYSDNKTNEDWVESDFIKISNKQNQLIHDGRLKANKVFISDTENITTLIFSNMFLGNDVVVQDLKLRAESQHFDLYILLAPTVPWVQDGTRVFGDERNEHFDALRNYLNKFGYKYVIINDDDYTERFEKSKSYIKNLIN